MIGYFSISFVSKLNVLVHGFCWVNRILLGEPNHLSISLLVGPLAFILNMYIIISIPLKYKRFSSLPLRYSPQHNYTEMATQKSYIEA